MKKIIIFILISLIITKDVYAMNTNANEKANDEKNKPKHFVELDNSPYTLEEIRMDLYFMTNHYSIASLDVIGTSYEGRPIYAVKVGVPSVKEKPSILVISNIHAREDFTSMLNMKTLDYILYSYYDNGKWDNYDIKDILSRLDIYFIPVSNPDGLNIAHYGIEASKNYSFLKTLINIGGDDRWWKANGNGVDLNRNFDDGNWIIKEMKSEESWYASEGFKGESPNSEPETKTLQMFCKKIRPLIALSLHSSGNLFYWADTDTHSKFDGIDTSIINSLSTLTGYKKMPVSQDPKKFSAGFENWFKSYFYRFAFVAELSPAPSRSFIQHPDGDFEKKVWNNAKYIIPQLAIEAIKYKNIYYDVYQNDKFLKTFYTKQKAISYAKKWSSSTVVNQGDVIWEF